MSYKAEAFFKRIKNLDQIICPPNSVKDKIRKLSPRDRAIYDEHRKKATAWTSARPGEQAYIDLLEQGEGKVTDDPAPELPGDFRTKSILSTEKI